MKRITKENESTILIEWDYRINSVPDFIQETGFMQSFESKKVKDIINYIFNNLCCDILQDLLGIEIKVLDGSKYINLIDELKQKENNNYKSLLILYKDYYNKELSYLDLSRLVYKLENVFIKIGVSLKCRTYANMYDARYSSIMMNE